MARHSSGFFARGSWLCAAIVVAVFGGCGDEDNQGASSTGGAGGADAGQDSSTGGSDAATGGQSGSAGYAGSVSDASTSDAAEDAADAAAKESCTSCHGAVVARHAGGKHAALPTGCSTCHQNALDHQKDPANVKASVEFTLDLCAGCHGSHKDSYLKDDGLKAGTYGGSVKTSKYVDFPAYKHLMGGHGFTVEYNEERAHAFLLKDHREIARKQNMVCLQCKSTPITYYFNEQRRGSYPFSMETAWADAINTIQQSWPSTMDHGASCTHCHDPHGTSFRVIRKAMIKSILERGTDPYDASKNVVPKTEAALLALMNAKGTDGKLTAEARRLAGTLTCAQCHVEYTCGPGIDKDKGILRDDFPWRKLKDIEAYYKVKYDNVQDWKHTGTGLPGIKAQHPETEFFWASPHYTLGVACSDCHMAKGANQTSHWFTSPFKQAKETCGKCHATDYATRVQTVRAGQDATWNQAKLVEADLDKVLTKIEALATDTTFDPQKLAEAKALFMRGLLWWEWTIVSENSTGAHNPPEAKTNLDLAASEASKAKTLLGL